MDKICCGFLHGRIGFVALQMLVVRLSMMRIAICSLFSTSPLINLWAVLDLDVCDEQVSSSLSPSPVILGFEQRWEYVEGRGLVCVPVVSIDVGFL